MSKLSLYFSAIILFVLVGCGGRKDFNSIDESLIGGKEIALKY